MWLQVTKHQNFNKLLRMAEKGMEWQLLLTWNPHREECLTRGHNLSFVSQQRKDWKLLPTVYWMRAVPFPTPTNTSFFNYLISWREKCWISRARDLIQASWNLTCRFIGSCAWQEYYRFAQRIKQLQGTRLGLKILRSSGLSHSDSIYYSSLIVSAWIYLSIIENGNSTQLHNFNVAILAEAKFSPKVNQFSSV